MKFLHTSDIHYGATPDARRPWGRERAQAVRDAFSYIIETCVYEQIDCLIISGGLFDGCPTDEEIAEVNTAFAGIPDTRVYVIAGESDPVFSSSPVSTFRWAENVIYNTSPEFKSALLFDGKLEIVGASDEKGHFESEKLSGAAPSQDVVSILVFSSSDTDESSIPEGFTYVAMGGSHKPSVKREGHLVNCGSPEPMGPGDAGKHGYYIGEIDLEDRKITALKFINRKTVKYITLAVNITPLSSNEDVIRNIKREIENRGTDNIYSVRLSGMSNPEVSFSLDELKYNYRIEEFADLTKPDYDYVQLFKDHPSDLVGFFIKEMNREDISDMDKKAMDYGITALLRTADERK